MDCTRDKLDCLPLEILQQIAGHLHDNHRASLQAFGLANQRCYRATLPVSFREIHLQVRNRRALQRDVDALRRILSRADAARHVRHLKIKGFLSSAADGSGNWEDEERVWNVDVREVARYKSSGIEEILPDEEPILRTRHFPCGPVITKFSEEDMAWAPVVELAKILPHLSTLVYDCRNQFPPSLLDALHKHHPQCRLHHLTFRLRSLLHHVPDAYEMALATSPCLYAVKVLHCGLNSAGDSDYNPEAIMELVAGLAPNLKEVTMVAAKSRGGNRIPRPRAPWKGLPGFVCGDSIGSLTSLSLVGNTQWTPDLLLAWTEHTDFQNLRQLALGGGFNRFGNGMDDGMMQWIIHNCSFPRLKAFRVRLERSTDGQEWPHYADNAISLFKSLEPLDELSVWGPFEPKMLDAILSRHGPTLKKLDLRPTEGPMSVRNFSGRRYFPMPFGQQHVVQIQRDCHNLEELSIPIKRTIPATVEAGLYKSFGNMVRLRSLFLTLDCSEWELSEESSFDTSFDEEDREYFHTYPAPWIQRGHVRQTFMKCATDETLARSIWATICQHKIGTELQSLKLWTTNGGRYGAEWPPLFTMDRHMQHIIDNLSRSWLIERDIGKAINVRELGRRAREARDRSLAADSYEDPGDDTAAMQIFRRVWPRREGSENWREDWSSLPLQA